MNVSYENITQTTLKHLQYIVSFQYRSSLHIDFISWIGELYWIWDALKEELCIDDIVSIVEKMQNVFCESVAQVMTICYGLMQDSYI